MIYAMKGLLNRCRNCKHYIKGHYCKAYPDGDGIPLSILTGKNDHSKPLEKHTLKVLDKTYEYESDNGITFEEK